MRLAGDFTPLDLAVHAVVPGDPRVAAGQRGPTGLAPVGTAPGVLRPRAKRCGHSHAPPAQPSEDTPCVWKLEPPSWHRRPPSRVLPWPDLEEVACPAAHGEPGLAAPSWRLVPEWLLSEPGMDSSQPGQRGPDFFLPGAKPMEEGRWGSPSPGGLAVYMEEASRPQVRPLGQPPHWPLGPRAQSPAQLAPWSARRGGVWAPCEWPQCVLSSEQQRFHCHRDGACPLGGHSQLWGVQAVHPSLSESPFCVPTAPS